MDEERDKNKFNCSICKKTFVGSGMRNNQINFERHFAACSGKLQREPGQRSILALFSISNRKRKNTADQEERNKSDKSDEVNEAEVGLPEVVGGDIDTELPSGYDRNFEEVASTSEIVEVGVCLPEVVGGDIDTELPSGFNQINSL